MERWMVAAFIFAAVSIGVIAQAWVSWLDHQRRSKALDVIKAAMEAGREPPQQVYDMLEHNEYASMGFSRRPWAEAVIFAAVAIGFWVAYGVETGDSRGKYLFIAAFMSAASVGCAALALFNSGRRPHDDPK